MIAQTSNEHLDELNARAQAIRHQHGHLGTETLPLPGRPYALHPGDEIQIRRTVPHPEHGQLRNGTIAQITDIDPDARTVSLGLADGRQVMLDHEQAARADLRLAYVQHPFPAQGQTTDTTHLIIGEHATQEGSYVALTRARQQTHIHAASADEESADADRLQALSERMSRAEPDLPSIHTPLAHESAIRSELARTSIDTQQQCGFPQMAADRTATSARTHREPASPAPALRETFTSPTAGEAGARGHAPPQLRRDLRSRPFSNPRLTEPPVRCATRVSAGDGLAADTAISPLRSSSTTNPNAATARAGSHHHPPASTAKPPNRWPGPPRRTAGRPRRPAPGIAIHAELARFRARGTVPEHGREGTVAISARV